MSINPGPSVGQKRRQDYKDEITRNGHSAIFGLTSCTLICCVFIPIAYLVYCAHFRFVNTTADCDRASDRS